MPVPARMHFRPIKLKALIPYLSIAMIYPVISLITAEKKLLKFIDAMTITGVIFLILGLIVEKMITKFVDINYEKAMAEIEEAKRLEEEARAAMEAEGAEVWKICFLMSV